MHNPAVTFRQLLPATPRAYATVLSVDTDGTSTVQGPTGATYKARGATFPAGTPVWIKEGAIEDEAPAMPVLEVEI